MPVFVNAPTAKFEDGLLTISVQPATNIGNMSLRFQVVKRFGDTSGLILKSTASGFGGASGNFPSGMRIVDSGNGIMQVQLRSADTSGLDFGAYGFTAERMDSGYRQILSQGFLLIGPNNV